MSLWTWGQRLPVLLQMEAAECGLASLAMVAAWHGHRVPLAELRRRFPASRKGSNLAELVVQAEALHLQARAVRCEPAQLSQLRLPAVLHWDMNHFVVLKAVRRGHLVVHDPAVGERRWSLAEAGRHFSGVALELLPTAGFARQPSAPPLRLRSLVGRVVGWKRGVAQVVALGLALEMLAVAAPFQLQWTVDHALASGDRPLLLVLGLGFLLLVALRTAIAALRSWLVVRLGADLSFQWLGHVLAHLLKLPLEYFEKRHLGAIMQNFGAVTHIQNTLTQGFVQALVDGALLVGTLAMMLLYSPPLAALGLAAVGLYALLRLALYPVLRHAAAEKLNRQAKQETHFIETARGVQTVRLFGRALQRRMGWQNLLAEEWNAGLAVQRVSIAQQAARDALFGALHVGVLWLAALAVLEQRFTVGMVLAFLAYQDQMVTRFAALVDKLFDLRMLGLHMERVADIVHTEPEAHQAAVPGAELRGTPAIALRGVRYRYATHQPEVLAGVDLAVQPGEFVAITGGSGSGKTTLVKLLLGLLAPQQGELLVDGAPVSRLGLDTYRAAIGTVMQDDHLFTGSVADNICFFDPQPDEAQIRRAARLAAVHDEIEAMPMGYASLVGDIGTGLSGGQQQRILLARALYRQPRILVLDEATSHLDLANEQAVNAALGTLALTRIVIAHRPQTLAAAQRVLHLEGGLLSEQASAARPASP